MLEKTDLDKYLEEGCLPRNTDLNLLRWWKINSSKYPLLQMIVKYNLSVSISTIDSESAFNTGGGMVNSQHSSLLPRHLNR